jgi:hypothetical protein
MTDRIQNLVDAGRLAREAASDEEIAGLWANAVQAFRDAAVEGVSANGKLVRAYDAGRIAATAVVRVRDLRVRAANHHELTLAVAALVSGAELARGSVSWTGCAGCGRTWSTAGRPARPSTTLAARWTWSGESSITARWNWVHTALRCGSGL